MPKAIDSRQVTTIFPRRLVIDFVNRPTPDEERPNLVRLRALYEAKDAGGEVLKIVERTKILWSGQQVIGLNQVLNQLESRINTAITEHYLDITGDVRP